MAEPHVDEELDEVDELGGILKMLLEVLLEVEEEIVDAEVEDGVDVARTSVVIEAGNGRKYNSTQCRLLYFCK